MSGLAWAYLIGAVLTLVAALGTAQFQRRLADAAAVLLIVALWPATWLLIAADMALGITE